MENNLNTTGQVRNAAVERLFYVTLIVAVVHCGFILWDLTTMFLMVKNDIVASSLMSNLYLILIGGYAGFKEIKRWLSKNPENVIMPEEKIIQFQRGEIIVYSWVFLFIAAVVLSQVKMISRMPMELTRTTIQSVTLLIATIGSRWVYQNKKQLRIADSGLRIKEVTENEKGQAAPPPKGTPNTDWECEVKVTEYIEKNGEITNDDVRAMLGIDRNRAYRFLEKLEKEGKIISSGEKKGAKYVKKSS